MGTRSLTYVYDGEKPIVCMYRQFDGYPTGHGAELAEFLTVGENNGMGCLAAQMIAHFKKSIGGFYIYPVDIGQDVWQEYEYHVYEDKCSIKEIGRENPIFEGTYDELKVYCSTERYDEEPAHAFDTQSGKDWLKSVLNDGVATITFTKRDGTERAMKCTLDRKMLPQVVTEETKKTKTISDDVLPVYDIEAQGWRSFRWDSITKVDIKL